MLNRPIIETGQVHISLFFTRWYNFERLRQIHFRYKPSMLNNLDKRLSVILALTHRYAYKSRKQHLIFNIRHQHGLIRYF